jgi:prepilin-type N-terminal cleavage/methylation domain-containing protein
MKLRPAILGFRERCAFTLIELLAVMAIIGIVAAVALPHMIGMTKANVMSAAARQLLDDVTLARQKAMANRTTVYMVFVPPEFWTGPNLANFNALGATGLREATNLITGQFTSYALMTLRSIGDQPGRPYPRYLTDWRHLPDGVFIPNDKFTITNRFDDTNVVPTKPFVINPFGTNSIPFPSIENGKTFSMPCIAFNSHGQLASGTDEFVPLARGSIFYTRDVSNNLTFAKADLVETPLGNATNHYNLVYIDQLTGRAKIVRQEIP